MPSSISYLIELPGREFNRRLCPANRVSEAELEKRASANELDQWEVGLGLGDRNEFYFASLTGSWTICTLPYPYSLFLGDYSNDRRLALIRGWEQSVRAMCPDVRIFRVDDFLLDPWEARYNDRLHRKPDWVDEFLDWLRTEDDRYWA